MSTFGVLGLPHFRSKNTTKIQRKDPQRERGELWPEREKKRAKFWAVRRREVRWRVVRRCPNHTNTNTARSGVEAKPRINVAPKRVGGGEEGGGEGGPKGGVPKGGPQRVWPALPGFRVWVWRVWGPGQNVGFGVSGVSV